MHIHQLDPQKHEKFLLQSRIDPITGDVLEAGDEIVICAGCKSAFHKDSWEYLGGTHCNQTRTLPAIPQTNSLGKLKKRSAEYYSRVNSNFRINETVTNVVSAGHRIGAIVIDLVMVSLVQIIIGSYMSIFLWTYFLLRDMNIRGKSLSIGKNFLGIQVIQEEGEEGLLWWQSVLRNAPLAMPRLIGVLSTYASYISYSFGNSFKVIDNLVSSIFTIILIIDIILLLGNNKRILDRVLNLKSAFRNRNQN